MMMGLVDPERPARSVTNGCDLTWSAFRRGLLHDSTAVVYPAGPLAGGPVRRAHQGLPALAGYARRRRPSLGPRAAERIGRSSLRGRTGRRRVATGSRTAQSLEFPERPRASATSPANPTGISPLDDRRRRAGSRRATRAIPNGRAGRRPGRWDPNRRTAGVNPNGRAGRPTVGRGRLIPRFSSCPGPA